MFRNIVIEREYGSGAGVIARKLSERLGWKLWDKAFTEELAKAAHVTAPDIEECSEKRDKPLYRLAKVFFRGSFETSVHLGRSGPLDSDMVMEYAREISARIAEGGDAIIVGRGAAYTLRKRRDTFRVFLFAPRAEKLRRLLADGQSHDAAEHALDTVDEERIEFVRHYFNKEWPYRPLYHLMINTSAGDELVMDTMLDSMHRIEEAKASENDVATPK
ncbi:MAG: cytidylate kinase-like family protein [Acidobacteriaceae bacterium]